MPKVLPESGWRPLSQREVLRLAGSHGAYVIEQYDRCWEENQRLREALEAFCDEYGLDRAGYPSRDETKDAWKAALAVLARDVRD